ncbi:hypothetical protein FB451DRAFT_1400376 [Mycena latifolia]|nr:hypothetical protein FB451DRAFT_1400376 [Mycena latifolia]
MAQNETDVDELESDTDVNGMIRAVAPANKFFVMDPTLMKKRLQTAAAKHKHEEKKASASGSNASGSRPPKKLRKKKDDSDDDIDDGADIEITVYIHIPMNAPTT